MQKPGPHMTARQLLEDAIRHERDGVLDRALSGYRAVVHEEPEPATVAEALRHIADVHRTRCEWDDAVASARESARVARDAGLPEHLAEALNAEALVHQSRGDLDRAVELFEQILHLTDDLRIHGIALQNLGSITASRGRLDTAEHYFTRSYRCFSQAAYLRGAAIALINYGAVAVKRREYELAEHVCTQALSAAREVEDLDLIAVATLNLADAMLGRQQNLPRAEELAGAALGYFSLLENPWRRVECLRLLGDVRLQQGFEDTARFCYERGLRIATSIGAQLEAAELHKRIAALPSTS